MRADFARGRKLKEEEATPSKNKEATEGPPSMIFLLSHLWHKFQEMCIYSSNLRLMQLITKLQKGSYMFCDDGGNIFFS